MLSISSLLGLSSWLEVDELVYTDCVPSCSSFNTMLYALLGNAFITRADCELECFQSSFYALLVWSLVKLESCQAGILLGWNLAKLESKLAPYRAGILSELNLCPSLNLVRICVRAGMFDEQESWHIWNIVRAGIFVRAAIFVELK